MKQALADGAGVVAWVDTEPVLRREIDARLSSMYASDASCRLPLPGTPQARQLARWMVQVLVVERVCHVEAAARGLEPAELAKSDDQADCEFGSIIATAFRGDGFVRAVFADVTASVDVDDSTFANAATLLNSSEPLGAQEPRYRVRHELFADLARAVAAARRPSRLRAMGVVTRSELPRALAEQVTGAVGDVVGPVRSSLGWHVAFVDEVLWSDDAELARAALLDRLRASARRQLFVRWVGCRVGASATLATGFEHPGDPEQPDNHHTHKGW